MADYYPLLSRAVANLLENTPETRERIFARAREALDRQLTSLDPPLGAEELAAEREALDRVIARIEAEFAPPTAELPIPPISLPELPTPAPAGAADAPSDAFPALPEASDLPGLPGTDAFRLPSGGEQPANGAATDTAPRAVEAVPPFLAPRRPESERKGDRLTLEPARRATDRAAPTNRKPVAIYALAGLVALGAMGALAWSLKGRPEANSSPPAPPVVAAPTTEDSAKREGRLAAEAPPAASPPAAAAPATGPGQPPAAVALPVSARAFMVLEVPGQPPGQFEGRTVWSFAPDSQNAAGERSLKAQVEFEAAGLKVEFAISRNRDPKLDVSHTILVIFDAPLEGSASVSEMSAIEWRERESQTGATFSGMLVPVKDNFFMIGLDKGEAAVQRNLDLMRTQKWMVFEIRLSNGRRGAVLIEKGVTGEAAIQQALTAWK